MTSKQKKEQPQKEETQKIYCGPSLPGFNQFTVLNGVPKHVEIHINECPSIKSLIVDVTKLNQTRLKLSVRGSYEEKKYYEVLDYLKGVK